MTPSEWAITSFDARINSTFKSLRIFNTAMDVVNVIKIAKQLTIENLNADFKYLFLWLKIILNRIYAVIIPQIYASTMLTENGKKFEKITLVNRFTNAAIRPLVVK
mgnify:CR=1 FL=1